MKALFADLKRFALVVILFTLTVVPVHPVWAGHPIARALSESSREIIAAMISAHGGMEKWRSAPTVSFEDHFLPAGAQKPTVSQVTVEQGPRRTYLDYPETNARIAWDGKQAWSENWQVPIPPRFIALLNYYFLNLPWLTMDPGVNLGEPGKAKLWDDPTEYVTVKMTFGAGVGDTPDDYYILYIDPQSHRLKACEYVVTYASLLPPGVKASPPHILIYEEFASVEGLVVPVRYSTYEKNHTLYATCEVRNWSFKKPFDATRMTIPPGAVIDTSSPKRTSGPAQ
jgi:hypothetical protein